jgi:small-conductance mechanosensitive channel
MTLTLIIAEQHTDYKKLIKMKKESDEEARHKFKGRILDILILSLILIATFFVVLIHLQISGQRIDTILESIIFGIILIEICGVIIYYYFQKRIAHEEARPLRSLFRIVAYVILAIIILTELNVNVTGILVSAGFLGIVLGLAAQSTLSNFISGVYLLSSKAFEPGDRVIIQTWQYSMMPPTYPHDKFIPGFTGTIKSIGVLYTELKSVERSEEDALMLVPNSIVAQALVINYHKEAKTTTKLQFDIDMKTDYEEIKKIIKTVMDSYGKKVEHYSVDVDSFHNTFYVISIHLKVDEINKNTIKNKIYEELILYTNRKEKKKHR